MENAIKSVLKHGENVKSLKYKEGEGKKKLKVKFEDSGAKNIAIKRMKEAHKK